ncbi:MAG: cryptochrome/photolyase family protein [Oligoflexia bacterium]|nr:cryptochrome/photolyase family protein [Oligoflexia bacterium]
MKVVCILGNQLFKPELIPIENKKQVCIFMREDRSLCTQYRFHKHKIIFFLSAMRKYALEFKQTGFLVHYEKLNDKGVSFEDSLFKFMNQKKSKHLIMFEIEDKFFEKRILERFDNEECKIEFFSSPMFLTKRDDFLKLNAKKLFMKSFYEAQRKKHKILVDHKLRPHGGKWSFDSENRISLPKNHICPKPPHYRLDNIDKEVIELVEQEFSDHPGQGANFWLPTDRKGAYQWAKDFFENRFSHFGPYEDAISKENDFVYHSILTPYLNSGLITPKNCISTALKTAKDKRIPINSLEGFIRQIIGWREFVRGVYQEHSELQESSNYFSHKRKLNSLWYSANTGIEPLDDVIKKVQKYGYAHHIERLMVVGSLMVLLEVDPKESYRWFMEMFIDSSDWVMCPNVYGMALFSDGGLFATKPYICGSNYYKKMANYKHSDWCDEVDGLYWTFIKKHKDKFSKNHRMAMMVRSVEKIPAERFSYLEERALALKERVTTK